MIKSISKIALVLFITFLSGLVLTDCVLPEVQSEERAEIEIEEENEVEIINLVQSELQTLYIDGGNDNEEQQVFQKEFNCVKSSVIFKGGNNNFQVLSSINKNVILNTEPKYILFGSLKLYS